MYTYEWQDNKAASAEVLLAACVVGAARDYAKGLVEFKNVGKDLGAAWDSGDKGQMAFASVSEGLRVLEIASYALVIGRAAGPLTAAAKSRLRQGVSDGFVKVHRTWNEFQVATKGQFGNRAEAGKAWEVYKEANNIVTGSVRNQAARREFLKSLVDNKNTPSWMKPWLERGRVPPGYEVDHIKPLSIGGPDTPLNMRLQLESIHDLHHSPGFYRPWEFK